MSKNYYKEENIQFFKVEELNELISNTNPNFYKMIFLLIYETGARIEEARALKFASINEEDGTIKMLTLKQRKDGVYRLLKISKLLLKRINEHKIINDMSNDDFIMAKKAGKTPATRQAVDYMMKKHTEIVLGKDLLKKANPITFRHSRAIHLLNAGMHISTLQKFLGHVNITNTLIYLRYTNQDLSKTIESVNFDIGLY